MIFLKGRGMSAFQSLLLAVNFATDVNTTVVPNYRILVPVQSGNCEADPLLIDPFQHRMMLGYQPD